MNNARPCVRTTTTHGAQDSRCTAFVDACISRLALLASKKHKNAVSTRLQFLCQEIVESQ